MFFWENAKRIAAVVHSIFNSIAEIASGKIKKAALWIERTLGRTVPIVISFFARMIGLGGISKTIKNIIKKIQDKVDKLLDKAVDWVVKKASKLWIVRAGKKALEKAKEFKEKAVEKGTKIKVPLLDGREEEITIKAGTQSGDMIRVYGKGMPRLKSTGYGDLVVIVDVKIPSIYELSRKGQKAIEELDKELKISNRFEKPEK